MNTDTGRPAPSASAPSQDQVVLDASPDANELAPVVTKAATATTPLRRSLFRF
jgi:hypothetical protein